jgi:hypothetical protein
MTGHLSRAAILAAFLFLVGFGGSVSAQPSDALQLRAAQAIQDTLEKLAGDKSHEDEKIQLVVEHLAKHDAKLDEMMKILGPLAVIASVSEKGDQKAEFFREIADWACKHAEADCELKKKLADHDARIADQGARLDKLERERLAGAKPKATPTPHVRPQSQPQAQTPPYRLWLGPTALITWQPSDLSPYAVLLYRCVNLDCADGDKNCHGDIYKEPDGRYILLRHTPRIAYHSVLATR